MTASKGKKQMSERAKEANWQNAQKSTGPQTPEGKAKVKYNALKTGLYCSDPVIPGEKIEDYEAFHLGLFHSLGPENTFQMALFDSIAAELWMLLRMPGTEGNLEVFSTYQEDYTSELKNLTLIKTRKVNILSKLLKEFRMTRDRALVAQNLEAILAIAHSPQAAPSVEQPQTQPDASTSQEVFLPTILPIDPEGTVMELVTIDDCVTHSKHRWFKNPRTDKTSAFTRQVDMMLGLLDMENPTPIDIVRNRLKHHPRYMQMMEQTG